MEIINIVPYGVLLLVIGFFLRKQYEELQKMRQDFNQHLLDDAQLKAKVESLKDSVNEKLDRILDEL